MFSENKLVWGFVIRCARHEARGLYMVHGGNLEVGCFAALQGVSGAQSDVQPTAVKGRRDRERSHCSHYMHVKLPNQTRSRE